MANSPPLQAQAHNEQADRKQTERQQISPAQKNVGQQNNRQQNDGQENDSQENIRSRDTQTQDTAPHLPVLLAEVMAALMPKDGAVYVDGTFGAGGYTRAILEHADCTVIAIDRDPAAIAYGQNLSTEFDRRVQLVQGCFSDMQALIARHGHQQVHGIMLDLGMSSMQIDKAERGFSFMQDGPLDMRMGQEGICAADIVNRADIALLARIIAIYGEERRAHAIARAIDRRRRQTPFTRTRELADLIANIPGMLGLPGKRRRIHPATRTFQALRIYLNDELGELLKALQASENLLMPGGRLAVVTFHSLEDRLVKKYFARRSGRYGRPSRHQPPANRPTPCFTDIIRGGQKPTAKEVAQNPRARSARLRVVERTNAPLADKTNVDAMSDLLPVLPGVHDMASALTAGSRP